ncbi:Protein CBG25711 [Caenorhabditis briggsae]|nr:Protein CBG25711 [Caenorhabditis briggsae]CAR99154.1 Protein CBG25711 [Caenorhabditis briggsae]
MPCVGV